jgi:hypothetical protein
MVNFNFTMDEMDAENFASILHDNILGIKVKITDFTLSDARRDWYRKHLIYLEQMYSLVCKSSKQVTQ